MRKFTLIISGLILCSCLQAQQDISFSVEADTNAILIGEQFQLKLSASVPESTAFQWPVWQDTIEGLEIIEMSKPDTSLKEGYWLITQNLNLTSFDSGFVFIPPLELQVNGQRFPSSAFPIEVKFPEINEEDEYYEIKDPLHVALDWWYILKWIGIISLALALVGGILYRVFFHNKKSKQNIEPHKLIPPYEHAMLLLDELQAKQLWQQGKTKEYYSELTDILRVFLERQFAINAMESTADEVYNKTKRLRLPEQLDGSLKEMLTLSALVKFAKANPGAGDNEKSFDTVKSFLQLYKPEEKEEQ